MKGKNCSITVAHVRSCFLTSRRDCNQNWRLSWSFWNKATAFICAHKPHVDTHIPILSFPSKKGAARDDSIHLHSWYWTASDGRDSSSPLPACLLSAILEIRFLVLTVTSTSQPVEKPAGRHCRCHCATLGPSLPCRYPSLVLNGGKISALKMLSLTGRCRITLHSFSTVLWLLPHGQRRAHWW